MSSKLSRSRRLQKYEHVYMKYTQEKNKTVKTPRKSRRKTEVELKPTNTHLEKKKKKKLNEYQKFVKAESKKQKYIGVSSSERFVNIALQWDYYKKLKNKK